MEFEIQDYSDSEEIPVPSTPERKVKSFALSTPDHELTLSPKLSVAQVFTTYQDLTAKLAAAREANEYHKSNETELQNQLSEIRTHAEEAKAVIDKRKATLEAENEDLVSTLETLPSVDFLQEQLNAIRQIDINESKTIDLERLISMGILHPGDTANDIPRRIQDIHADINQALANGLQPKDRVDREKSLRRKILLLKTAKEQNFQLGQQSLSCLRNEIAELEERIRAKHLFNRSS